ncbi:MAG: P-loop NTPase, partial [Firmicutes bacterium]|nr:P-loop NTPase [Bacillota bacterium]
TMGKIILTASGKGGCGKSTFAVNLGYTLAAAGLDTLLVDFNIGLRNLDLYLGLQDRVLFISAITSPAHASCARPS